MSLLPVSQARDRVLAGVAPLPPEAVELARAIGRTLAEPVLATRDQPPFRSSAMDGYALSAGDTVDPSAPLEVIGISAAGDRYDGPLGPGEAVRIFTGAPVPDEADAVLIQENVEKRDNGRIVALQPVPADANIRPAALDFATGDTLLAAGKTLGFGDIALAAAAGHATMSVHRRPVVSILATGDELVAPGGTPGPDQIFASTGVAIETYLNSIGAEGRYLGIAHDSRAAIAAEVKRAVAMPSDILVTIGGVSVGDHDLVQATLGALGMKLDFWKVAMRPGKPLMFGTLGDMRVIGLPGNPVSSIVCMLLFLRPMIDAMLGRPLAGSETNAVLGVEMPANGERASYVRATISDTQAGPPTVTPVSLQDSSALTSLAVADCLLIRDVDAPAAKAGASARIMMLR